MTEEKASEDKKAKTAKKTTKKKPGRPKKQEPEWYVIIENAAMDGPDEGAKCVITTSGSLAEDLDLFMRANKLDLEDIRVYELGGRVVVKLQPIIKKWADKDDT